MTFYRLLFACMNCEHRLKMEYADVWSRCCLSMCFRIVIFGHLLHPMFVRICFFDSSMLLSVHFNPCLVCFFILLARRELLHSYGFEYIHLLYNLEKAGLFKRQVSQIWASPNLFFRVICGSFNVTFFCLPNLHWHIVVLPRNQEAIGLVLQEHCSL